MLTALDLQLLTEDERRIAAEEDTERRRLDAVLNVERAMRERQEAVARAEEERENWRAIIGSCAYLDSLPDARKDFLVRVFNRMAEAKPELADVLLRAARYIRPPLNPLLQTVSEAPVYLVPPLTTEEGEAADGADECRRRIEAKIEAMHKHPVARHLKCGRTRTIHLRRDRDKDAVEDMLIKPHCGRHDCPRCWRRRLTKTYRRAAGVLLRDSADSNRPRIGPLHVAEIDWLNWEALDKAIRRQHGGDVGRMRIHRSDNRVLIVCVQPFRCSRPVSPSAACDLASDAIDQLDTARHSFRLLGDWNDAGTTEWRLVARLPGTLDFAKVADRLLSAGRKSRAFKTTELRGLIWRVESEMAAVRLETLITTPEELCPSLASWEYRDPNRPKSDTPPSADGWGTIDDDGWMSFDQPEPGG